MPYRSACPPPVEPPEPDHPYAAVIAAAKRRTWMRVAVMVGGVVGVVSLVRSVPKPAAASLMETVAKNDATARAAIESARTRAGEEQHVFDRVLRDAIGRLDALPKERSPSGAPCPLPMAATERSYGRSFPLLLVSRAEVSNELPSQAVAEMLVDVRRAEQHRSTGQFELASTYARALASPARLRHEVVLVTTLHTRAQATGANAFVQGRVEGDALLYDFASRRVVCAGHVEAKSSTEIGYAYTKTLDALPAQGAAASMQERLDEDLVRATERAVATSLRALDAR